MEVTINLYESGFGGYQISLDEKDTGYRLMGPKFCCNSRLIRKQKLSQTDAIAIVNMLKRNYKIHDSTAT